MEEVKYKRFTSRSTGNNVRYVKMHYCGLLLIRGDYVLIQERPVVKKVYFNQMFESNYGQHHVNDMASEEIEARQAIRSRRSIVRPSSPTKRSATVI